MGVRVSKCSEQERKEKVKGERREGRGENCGK